jgi:hypothetical protein
MKYYEYLQGRVMSAAQSQRYELGSVQVLPDGESFVLLLVGCDREVHRVELPCWTVHQLMRILPRLDATLMQARESLTTDLVAYPVVHWNVQRTGADSTVAMSVRDERQVESAFLLHTDDARALHAALGETLDDELASSTAAPARQWSAAAA